MATILEALTVAIKRHQEGHRQEAERLYRQILEVDPQQPDAIHLLGVLAAQTGQHELAVEYIRRAIVFRETAAPFHVNLGNALHALGALDEAISCYRRAPALQPDVVEGHSNLGNALRVQGKLEEAAACYRLALEIKPDFAEAHNNLGNAFKTQARLDDAVNCYRRALAIDPTYAERTITWRRPAGTREAGRGYRQLPVRIETQPSYAESALQPG